MKLEEKEPQSVESYSEAMNSYSAMDVDTFDNLPRDKRLVQSQFLVDLIVSNENYDSATKKILVHNRVQQSRLSLQPTIKPRKFDYLYPR